MGEQSRLRRIVVLSLLGLLLLTFAPPQGALARPLHQSNRNRSTLCGRLVFLEDLKTGARLIGLIPCNESRPLIFAARPGELFEFYRLTNVVIKKGDKVTTLAYGVLENYITRFESYKQIYSCRDCDPNAASARPPSAGQAADCSAWVLEHAATAFPALNKSQELEQIQQNLQAYAGGEVVKQACGVDSACRIGETAQQLGVQLGPRLHWNGLQAEQVIDWLAGLLSDPASAEVCPSMDTFAPRMIAGLNQQGHGIDHAAIGEGCDLLASDAAGHSVGFVQGSPVEQIPGARAAVAPQGQRLLLPASAAARLEFTCSKNAIVTLHWVQRDPAGIHQYIFSRLSIRNQGGGEIDLSLAPPVMRLDARGDGNAQERGPDRSLLFPALVALLSTPTPSNTPVPLTATVSPTPQPPPSATPMATATVPPPSPTAAAPQPPAPTATPETGRIEVCSIMFGVALLPGFLWLKKNRKSRPQGYSRQ
jgi:hypothetical protein